MDDSLGVRCHFPEPCFPSENLDLTSRPTENVKLQKQPHYSLPYLPSAPYPCFSAMKERVTFASALAFIWIIIKITHFGVMVTDLVEFIHGDDSPARSSAVPSPFYDKDVVVLSQNNFREFIAENQYVVVNFYSPWCNRSKQLAPEYDEAATTLKGKAVLAKVDVTIENELVKESKSRQYSSLQIYIGGFPAETYQGEPNRDAISTWVNSILNHTSYTLTTRDEAKAAKQELISKTQSFFYLGFFNTLKDKEAAVFAFASKLNRDIKFYQTTSFDVVSELSGSLAPNKRPALLVVVKRTGEILYLQDTSSDPFNRCTLLMSVLQQKRKDSPHLFVQFIWSSIEQIG